MTCHLISSETHIRCSVKGLIFLVIMESLLTLCTTTCTHANYSYIETVKYLINKNYNI